MPRYRVKLAEWPDDDDAWYYVAASGPGQAAAAFAAHLDPLEHGEDHAAYPTERLVTVRQGGGHRRKTVWRVLRMVTVEYAAEAERPDGTRKARRVGGATAGRSAG